MESQVSVMVIIESQSKIHQLWGREMDFIIVLYTMLKLNNNQIPDKTTLLKMPINEILHELYHHPLTGFGSTEKLLHKAKLINPSVSYKQVQDFLKNQPVTQLTKPIIKRRNKYSTIVSPSKLNNFQMDIMYLPDPTTTNGFKYLLTAIDVYSRYVFVQLLKTKTGQEVFDKIRFMFQQSGFPKNLNVDEGSEFVYSPFESYCNDNDIRLWYSSPEQDNKNSIIERFHRTLRGLILKYKLSSNQPFIHSLRFFSISLLTTTLPITTQSSMLQSIFGMVVNQIIKQSKE
mgnify:CR=1 FL=1